MCHGHGRQQVVNGGFQRLVWGTRGSGVGVVCGGWKIFVVGGGLCEDDASGVVYKILTNFTRCVSMSPAVIHLICATLALFATNFPKVLFCVVYTVMVPRGPFSIRPWFRQLLRGPMFGPGGGVFSLPFDSNCFATPQVWSLGIHVLYELWRNIIVFLGGSSFAKRTILQEMSSLPRPIQTIL